MSGGGDGRELDNLGTTGNPHYAQCDWRKSNSLYGSGLNEIIVHLEHGTAATRTMVPVRMAVHGAALHLLLRRNHAKTVRSIRR